MKTTRHAIHHLIKLVCAFALVLTIGPARAVEAVCVMPNRAVVPMATCGMPCCAPKDASRTTCSTAKDTSKAACCREKNKRSLIPSSKASLAKFACRCELRPKATFSVAAVQSHEKPLAAALSHAVLSEEPLLEATPWTFVPEPGVLGSDSGPPPEALKSGPCGRAPPAR